MAFFVQSLTMLDLNGDDIDDVVVHYLADALQSNTVCSIDCFSVVSTVFEPLLGIEIIGPE